jgi:hypothetical protein
MRGHAPGNSGYRPRRPVPRVPRLVLLGMNPALTGRESGDLATHPIWLAAVPTVGTEPERQPDRRASTNNAMPASKPDSSIVIQGVSVGTATWDTIGSSGTKMEKN